MQIEACIKASMTGPILSRLSALEEGLGIAIGCSCSLNLKQRVQLIRKKYNDDWA